MPIEAALTACVLSVLAVPMSGPESGSDEAQPQPIPIEIEGGETWAGATGLGMPCGRGADCSSGFCADGVCCATACEGGTTDCRACAMTLTGVANGTCAPLSVAVADSGVRDDGARSASRSGRVAPRQGAQRPESAPSAEQAKRREVAAGGMGVDPQRARGARTNTVFASDPPHRAQVTTGQRPTSPRPGHHRPQPTSPRPGHHGPATHLTSPGHHRSQPTSPRPGHHGQRPTSPRPGHHRHDPPHRAQVTTAQRPTSPSPGHHRATHLTEPRSPPSATHPTRASEHGSGLFGWGTWCCPSRSSGPRSRRGRSGRRARW
jgi:hypothetical protein